MNLIVTDSLIPLASFTLDDWLSWQERHHPSEIDLGLERVSQVANRLAILSPKARVITVAGTNGKGSCIAALEALLTAAGKRFGAYTSPHFLRYNERIRLQGVMVDDSVLCDAFHRIYNACEGISLTYFEYGTLAAMLILNDQPLDYWLLEVGLGGRLDAVNIIDPNIAVITSVALDHEAWLGNTREAIGYEKAGICRSQSPFICAESNPPHTVIDHVKSLGCPTKWWGQDFEGLLANTDKNYADNNHVGQNNLGQNHAGQTAYSLRLSNGNVVLLEHLPLPLPSVMAALEICIQESILPPAEQLPFILANIALMGRMQQIDIQDVPVVLDVAHNPAATSLLANRLASQALAPRTAILGMMADKDIYTALLPLLGQIERWFCAELPDNPRAASAEQLSAVLQEHKVPTECIYTADSVVHAIDAYRALSSTEKQPLLIFGSFFTVADALTYAQTAEKTS